MRSQLLTLLTGLTAVVTAHPGAGIFERQACNVDNCLRALRASTNGPASTDCSSFLGRTVTSCGGSVTTTTITTTMLSTETRVFVATSTSLTTVSSTTTVAGPTSTITSTTSVNAGTSTTTSTSTITTTLAVSTVTTTTTLAAVPTGPGGPGTPGQPGKVKRQQCVPTTATPSSIPNYAAAGCARNTSRYSSACRCIGVTTGSTVTVGAAASTVTVTASTVVFTSTSSTITIASPSTVRPTATVSTTVTTTTTTTVVVGASTTVTISTTVTSTTATGSTTVTQTVQPTSGTFQLVLPGGRKLGINPSDNSLVPVEGGINGATFSLNQFSYLQSSSLTFGVNAVTGGPDTVFGFATTPANPLRCTVSNPPNRGALICRVSASERFFSLCNNKVVLANSFQPEPCAAIDLQAV